MPETEVSFLNPERVVSYFDIPRGSVVADFGSGPGFYSIPLAEKVGPEGKVYAFDIQQRLLDLIRSKARLLHLLNISTARVDLERERGTGLRDGILDFILVASVLHQVDRKDVILQEVARILKPGRRMAMIEWDESKSPPGPPSEFRIPKAKAKSVAEMSGFELDREFEAGSHHYGLLFRKR